MLVQAVAAAAFILDYLTKRYVESHLYLGQVVPVIPGVFDFAYIRNSGAAFGILRGQTFFLVAVTVAVLAFVALYGDTLARMGPAARVGVGLVVGGSAGNLVDRITYGGVVDFLHVHHWPVFNVADSSVVVGGVLIAWTLMRERPEPPGQPLERRTRDASPSDADDRRAPGDGAAAGGDRG